MTKKIRTYITLMLLFLCQSIVAQNKTPTNDSRNKTMVDFYISVIKRYRKELLKLSTLIVADAYFSTLKSASNLNGNLNCSKELEHYSS